MLVDHYERISRGKQIEENRQTRGTEMIEAVHHIAIIVSGDLCLEFYRLLGFVETYRNKREHDTVVLMNGYGIQLELFIDPSHPSHVYGPEEPIGLRHFSLKVDRLEDEIKRLRVESEEIIEVGPIMNDWTGVRFCVIKDYDGLPIELHE